MLDLEVVPERSLGNEQWEFALGMPLFQAVQILQRHCRVMKDVDVLYNEKCPFDSDLTLNLVHDGIKLLFDAENQRLKVIEVYDLTKMKLKYCGAYFSSPDISPTISQIDTSFGPTHAPQFDEKHHMFVLSFRGISFIFPFDHQYETSSSHALRNLPNAQSIAVAKMCIYSGNSLSDTNAPPMPMSCYHGNLYSECTDILLCGKMVVAVQLRLAFAGEKQAGEQQLQALIRQVRFGDSTQDVMTKIGSPCKTFYKLEDKMRIHSAGPHKLSPSHHSDYFYNYFTLGMDILFDGQSHRAKKFILHSNHPSHYNFNIYHRCQFKIDLQGEKGAFVVVPTTTWDSVIEKLGGQQGVGEPVILNRASSTNTTNPFGSTFCYGIQNMIFEVMKNKYIAAVTLYQPTEGSG